MLRLVDLDEDVYLFGLQGCADAQINRKLRTASSRLVGYSPTASLATTSDTSSSGSPATATMPIRRSRPTCLFGTLIGSIFEGQELIRNA